MEKTQWKFNESGFRPHLCMYRLNWARRTSWGWWDEWDDIVLQTQDSKFEHRRSETEHATSRLRRLPTILNLYEWAWKKHFVSLKFGGQSGVRTRDLRLSKQAVNHCTTRQTGNICIPFIQRRPNVYDAGPTLYKCYTNVSCLLGRAPDLY